LLKRDSRLSAEDCLKIAEEMQRIDKVLQVLPRI
jgi:hypothetical protein